MDAQSPLQSEIEQLVGTHGRDRTALMPVLQELNRSHSYLSEEAMVIVSKELRVPRSEVYGVATFYSFLSVKPRGKYVIRLCRTISCAIAGKYHPAVASLLAELGIAFGETTQDGLEMTFATNHMAYFVVTNLLLANLKATPGARIVSTASSLISASSLSPSSPSRRR